MLYAVYTRIENETDLRDLDTVQTFRSLNDARTYHQEMESLLGPSRIVILTMIEGEMIAEVMPPHPVTRRKFNA